MVESLAEARFRLIDLSPSVQMEDVSSFSRTPISVEVSGLSHFVSAMGTVSSIERLLEHGDERGVNHRALDNVGTRDVRANALAIKVMNKYQNHPQSQDRSLKAF